MRIFTLGNSKHKHMGQILKAKVNSTFDIDISLHEISKIDVQKVSDSKFHLLHKNKSIDVEIITSNFYDKRYQISVDNTIYDVDILNDLDQLILEMGFSVGSKKEIKSVNAPMPGLILDIPVEIGQEVNEDDTLLILEAMKMENSITSPISGVVKSIHINKGDAVEKNQILIEFE